MLRRRQACAIESAAKWNSNRDIFVLFTAPLGLPSNGQLDSPILNALSSYINIQFRNMDWYKYAVDTPADEWVKKDKMLTTKHFKGHLSDFIRLLSLYKFGGIHLDLDFIVQKTFDDLPPNFFGAQDDIEVQNAVFGLESRNVGHTVADLILRFVKLNNFQNIIEIFSQIDPMCHFYFHKEILQNITRLKIGIPMDQN